ncbi:Signal transduction histidine kinase [Alteromonadaceae bacterium Bs31]|nr:Signal transduction histidine kinase [Alteromonadaceae bacterium Bs31]
MSSPNSPLDEKLSVLLFYKASGRNSRQLRICQILGLTLGLLFLIRALEWQVHERVFSLIFLLLCCLLSLWLSVSGQLLKAVHVYLLGYALTATTAMYTSGGVHNVATAWLLLLPCLSALLGGQRVFSFWAAIAMLVLAGIVGLNMGDIGLSNRTPMEFQKSQDYIHVLAQLLTLSLCIYAFFSQFEEYEQQINAQVRKVEKEIQSRRVAEKLALESNQAKTRFLSNMSHQLRTPLNSIIGFSRRMVLRKISEPERQMEMLEGIHRNGQTLLKVINDLLELANLDNQEKRLNWQPVELSEVVSGELSHYSSTIDSQSNKTLAIARLEPFQMIGDLIKLPKIFRLLFEYFIRHTEASGIVVECYPSEAKESWCCVSLRIKDCNIAVNVLEALINVGGETSIVATVDSGVSGLGLAITARLVELHQGSIHISSPNQEQLLIEILLPSVPVLAESQQEQDAIQH